jgi:hypothetical protein
MYRRVSFVAPHYRQFSLQKETIYGGGGETCVCVAMWVWPPSRVRCCATQPLDLCALCVRYKGRSRSDALLAERSLRLYMSAAACAGDENRCCCCHSCKQLRSQLWRIYMFRWKTLLLLHSTSQQGKLYSTAMWEEFNSPNSPNSIYRN